MLRDMLRVTLRAMLRAMLRVMIGAIISSLGLWVGLWVGPWVDREDHFGISRPVPRRRRLKSRRRTRPCYPAVATRQRSRQSRASFRVASTVITTLSTWAYLCRTV